MRRNRVLGIPVAIWLFGLSAGVSAQSAPPAVQSQQHDDSVTTPIAEGTPLTVQAAIDKALRSNPQLVQLRAQFEAARIRPVQERFLMAPTFEAQIWQWPINTINPLNTNMYMLTASQDIPGRGKRQLQQTLAEKDAALAGNVIAVRARDIVEQVKRAYADLFVSRKAIEIHLESVDLLRQFADVSTIKYSTGRISQQDVLKSVLEISKLHQDLVMHEESEQRATAQLNTLLNRLPETPIGAIAEPPERLSLPPTEELQRRALERHPELRGAALSVERAQAAVAVADGAYKPDFTVGGGYMLMPHGHDAWTASVGITWPTARWARGRLDAQKAVATAEVEAARAEQRAMESQVRLAVHDAYIRVKSAEQQAALLRTTVVPQSQHTLEVARAAYQTDRVDLLALIDNQRELLDAQLGYFRALSDLEQARADLERAVGEDLLPIPPETDASAKVQTR
jgi:outer membrane protein, heavy metal efflux system